jgi:hypothetical protein
MISQESINANWMETNWELLKDKKLKDIFLPGTHNSASYQVSFDMNNSLFKNLKPLFKFLGICILNRFTRQLTINQELNVYNQLIIGTRYLDLRISYYDNIYYCTHTYMCAKLDDVIKQINKFNTLYPNEIIIIMYKPDWEHRNTIDNDLLTKYMNENIGSVNTMPKDSYLFGNTLLEISEKGKIILLPNFYTRWYNTADIKVFIQTYETDNPSNIFNILDTVLTPNNNNFTKSLKKYSQEIKNWIINYEDFKYNVYAFDYIDISLCNLIINRNFIN